MAGARPLARVDRGGGSLRRSVAGPLRRAHPASGATWNVQVVRGKMSSRCLWHACRALAAGLLLMLLGAAMATIGYYADTLSVAQEVRGNSTVAVKNEARGFHLNNLSYAGPIVMGVGGFIVVAACVMTFEARDSAAKVTPARPQTTPRRPTHAPWDQLGLFRGAAPAPRSSVKRWRGAGGSAPELCAARTAARTTRPQPHHALSFEEAPQFEHRHESQTSLALELHACGGVLLRVRDRSAAARRRVLARQHPLPDNEPVPSRGSPVNSIASGRRRSSNGSTGLSVGSRAPRACSAPPRSPPHSEPTPRRDSQ